MVNSTTKVTSGIGWLLLVAGVLVLGGFAIYALAMDASTPLYLRLGVGALYGGLGLLLLSVLRQQLAARRTDRYKDVQQ